VFLTILGTVKDQSGAVIAGATVDIINTDTNTTTKLVTNNWDYKAFTNRIDLQLTPKQRMFGKWSYSNFSPGLF
jgi:hypothetical protein